MKNISAITRANIGILVALICLSGCAGTEEPTVPVNLGGTITLSDGAQNANGKVTVNLYHAWALEGELRHPVEFIESFETTVGDYRHAFDYPVDRGEGLLVYAWIDQDSDGVHCTPSVRIDLAGLTEVSDFSFGEVKADIELDTPCAGPDWFYPPAADQ